ncbi:MAG: flippase-like domain-containing protein [Muribaculaceae bacterium]|nr:flippase-like domain-containing protein [Muribaculaceae bacterium]
MSEKERKLASSAAPVMEAEEQIEHAVERRPRGWLTLALRYLLPLALTVALVWYMFHKVDFSSMMAILREGVDYWWILLAMGISVFSHVARAARWRLQLRSLGIDAPFMALCCSIFGCYALNLVFPRLGEVWRCTYISRREKAPFTTVLGSMVSDRLTDTASVLLLTALTFIVANGAIRAFLARYPVGQDFLALVENPWLWTAVALFVALVVCAFRLGRHTPVVRKLLQWLGELWAGFATLWHMKGRLRFALLTVAIWGCFFVQLYVAFFAFPFTRALCAEPGLALGLTPCLVAFVLSSIGMAIPSNGGLGPWNIAIMFGLAIYGVSDAEGTAFSMLQWSGQTVMLILLGIFTMIYISVSKPKNSLPHDRR